MAQSKFRNEAARPLFAYVGVTDRAVEVVRGSVADIQRRIVEVQKDVEARVNNGVGLLSKEAQARRTVVEARVGELQERAKALPEKVQALLEDNEVTYGQLVARGETLVTRIRNQESTRAAVQEAETAAAEAKATAAEAAEAARATAKTAQRAAKKTENAAERAVKKTADTARKTSTAPRTRAKATGTTVKRAASKASQATVEATKKVGD
jgi:heparin binding hemagglutinin HbhA